MSSKIKNWNYGKLFISNGVGCSGCSQPNLAQIIEPKPKIPINTNPSPNICHTSSSSYQNDDTNLSHESKTNSESEVSTYSKIGDTFVVVKNLDDPFQDNHTSIPFSIINIDSLSPPSIDKNDVTDLSQSKTNSKSKVSTCPNIDKNLDDSFQDNYHTSTTFSI
ncbi:hypothetical protein H5410_000949 [Solanum commersonii]|uniref:Uncharacterized protein n=1 Tax=Solanum commersonii TaxID=4109 RepID=A0A9J6AXM2_SOLCO|nr:hypothetical protein H5410_000949 [Solanum commersonii]